MDGMEIFWDEKQHTIKIAFSGRLDALTAAGHEQQLFRALEGRENAAVRVTGDFETFSSEGHPLFTDKKFDDYVKTY